MARISSQMDDTTQPLTKAKESIEQKCRNTASHEDIETLRNIAIIPYYTATRRIINHKKKEDINEAQDNRRNKNSDDNRATQTRMSAVALEALRPPIWSSWISTTLESPLRAALLADECGTGKTVQIGLKLAIHYYRVKAEVEAGISRPRDENRRFKPSIILSPPDLAYQAFSEWLFWFLNLFIFTSVTGYSESGRIGFRTLSTSGFIIEQCF
ncbi:hypothetical protein NOF04DRAFT_1269222 [Fusarium oxysporum II5]|nr:hypothetical protein NOF04DRAFT_1269222 [Fusarium oxysporum II5]